MEITFTNRNDRSMETLFNGLTEEVFGLSFRKWHDLGVWDERYECYSVITGQKMIANVSLYKTDMHPLIHNPQICIKRRIMFMIFTNKASKHSPGKSSFCCF